jgi:hypothetical protein
MSKFKKVSQIEQIPSILEKSFFGTPENDDPYAELKANSQDNRTKIAKQTGFNREASFKNNSWEKIQGPSLYNELRDLSFEERVAEIERTAGLSAETIKRSSYAYDEGDNARTLTSGLKAFSSEDYMAAMLSRSASIFNPDMIDIAESFKQSQEATSQQAIVDQQQQREARASKHQSWESSKMNELRKSSVVNSRGHNILRSSTEYAYDASFGAVDLKALDEREALRVATAAQRRESKLGLEKKAREEFESRAELSAQTINQIYNRVNLDFDKED